MTPEQEQHVLSVLEARSIECFRMAKAAVKKEAPQPLCHTSHRWEESDVWENKGAEIRTCLDMIRNPDKYK